jgi:hypothetical protein
MTNPMRILWKTLFGTGSFIPHGRCYLWQPELVWLNVFSDTAIALAYFSIPMGSLLSQESDLVKTLRFEKGMGNVLFVAMGDR